MTAYQHVKNSSFRNFGKKKADGELPSFSTCFSLESLPSPFARPAAIVMDLRSRAPSSTSARRVPPTAAPFTLPSRSSVPSISHSPSSPHAPEPQSKRRTRISVACARCKKLARKCDEGRPCQRCVSTGHGESCEDAPRAVRKVLVSARVGRKAAGRMPSKGAMPVTDREGTHEPPQDSVTSTGQPHHAEALARYPQLAESQSDYRSSEGFAGSSGASNGPIIDRASYHAAVKDRLSLIGAGGGPSYYPSGASSYYPGGSPPLLDRRAFHVAAAWPAPAPRAMPRSFYTGGPSYIPARDAGPIAPPPLLHARTSSPTNSYASLQSGGSLPGGQQRSSR